MAKQTIGIGSAGNDGNGDPLRTAFGKANSNFTELYDGVASKADASATTSALAGKANTSHTHAQSEVTNLTTDLAGKVATSRSVSTEHSLTGGGDLTADRTLALVGDTASPGANKVYGTDGEGNRGWKDDPEGGEGGGPITTDDITDAGATGIALVQAETESDGLDALGIEEGDEGLTISLVFADAEAAPDGTYRLCINARRPFTIASLSHMRNTRTAGVVAVKINGTDVTSLTSIAPGATMTTTNATAANTGDAGDEVSVVISGDSDMTGLVAQINGVWG